jgi:hypothetical protein
MFRQFIMIPIFIFFSLIPSYLLADSFQKQIPFRKDINQYSSLEINMLRERWTKVKVDSIIYLLKNNQSIDKMVPTFYSLWPYPLQDTIKFFDLRGIDFSGKDLSSAQLSSCILQFANLWSTNFKNAELSLADMGGTICNNTNFENAYIGMAKFNGANCSGANFLNAEMSDVNFGSAVLENANLKRAWLWKANLYHTDLRNSLFDSTYLWDCSIESALDLKYIIWGGYPHPNRYIIGEEFYADSSNSQDYYHYSYIIYQKLHEIYKKELLPDISNEFGYRLNEVQRKSHKMYDPRSIWLMISKLTYGYGYRPIRLLWSAIAIIVIFSGIYLISIKSGFGQLQLLKNETKAQFSLKYYNIWATIGYCIYFSASTFCMLGYGPLQLKELFKLTTFEEISVKPIRIMRLIAGIEALLGIWIFILLASVIVRAF